MLNVSILIEGSRPIKLPALPSDSNGSLTDYSDGKETIIVFGSNAAGDCATVSRSNVGLSIEHGIAREIVSGDLEVLSTITPGNAFTLPIVNPHSYGAATLVFEME